MTRSLREASQVCEQVNEFRGKEHLVLSQNSSGRNGRSVFSKENLQIFRGSSDLVDVKGRYNGVFSKV